MSFLRVEAVAVKLGLHVAMKLDHSVMNLQISRVHRADLSSYLTWDLFSELFLRVEWIPVAVEA